MARGKGGVMVVLSVGESVIPQAGDSLPGVWGSRTIYRNPTSSPVQSMEGHNTVAAVH